MKRQIMRTLDAPLIIPRLVFVWQGLAAEIPVAGLLDA
jgi:hypothetical protein